MQMFKERHTLSVLVDNESGVLSQVSRLFSRKGYNIESLAVGTTDDPLISRITIEVLADEDHAELLCNQLRKLFPVHSVKRLSPGHSIRRELVLVKVTAKDSTVRNEIIQIANIAGSAGDYYVIFHFLFLPDDILVYDTGTAMTIYSAQK